MTLTSHRVIQYIGILLILALGGGGYWYWHNAQAAVTQKAASKTGLVGYWSFDEGDGTQAGDASGNGNTGTLTNGPTWVDGKLGKTINFDGVNDYVTVTNNASLQITGDMTISVWVNLTNNANYNPIISRNGAYEYEIAADLRTGVTNLSWRSTNSGTATNWTTYFSGYTDKWVYVTVVVSGTNATAYRNGVSMGAIAIGTRTTTTQPLLIGNRTGGYYFKGSIDEPHIYNRALSATEIADLYTLGAAKVNTSQNSSLTSGLVGLWSFDGADVSGTTAYDRSGQANNGTLTNGPTTTIGKLGQGVNFDGGNFIAAGTALSNPTVLTISAWVNPSRYHTQYDYFVSTRSSDNSGWSFGLSGAGKVDFVLQSVAQYPTSGTHVPLNKWSHVVMVWKGNNTTVDYYVDGVFIQTIATGALVTSSRDILIGNQGNTATAGTPVGMVENADGYGLEGSLDEVRIYSRALSATEIQSLYTQGGGTKVNSSVSQPQGTGRLDSGLAGYWRLDDGSGTTATDSSTNANTGTLTGGPTWGTGQIGSAVTFDGVDDYATVPYSSSLTSSQNITYSFWVNPNLNEVKGILGALNGELGSAYNYIMIDNNGSEVGNPQVTITRSIGGSTGSRSVQFAYPVSTWFHYTYTYDGSYERVFINGTKQGEWAQTGNFATNTEYGLMMGQSGSLDYMNGKLDEVRVYTRALSADEVSQLYRLTTPTGVDTSLKGYWSFNGQDMNGTTAYDRSGSANTSTLINGPTPTIGKIGQALSFDGVNDAVQVADNSSLRPNGSSWSMALWAKPENVPVYKTLLSKRQNVSPYEQYGIAVGLDVRAGTSGKKIGFCYIESSAGTEYCAATTNDIADGNWHHIGVVFNSNDTYQIYIDGILQGLTVLSNTGGYPTINNTDPLYFNFDNASSYSNVPLDEVRIYSRALTAAEITALYDLGR